MLRVFYSFVSAALKVVIFLLTVITAYRVHDSAEPVLGAWVTIPFVCLAILGSKYFVESADEFLRRKLGFTVSRLDD